MKNKKGFTLIELIAVIVILGIILVIATISIQSFVTKGKNKSFDVLVNSFEDSAKTAFTECILNPNNDFCKTHKVPNYNEKVTVTLGELIDFEYSDVLKNPWKTSEACDRNSTVTLTRKESSQIVFDYKTCLICGDHKTCDSEENGNGGSGSTPTPSPTPAENPIISPTPTPEINTTNLLKDMILEDNEIISSSPTLTTSFSKSSDKSGLYISYKTNSGNPTYYFRGNVTNNYIRYAGKIWRVIRINEDGTIRMVLNNRINKQAYYNNANKGSGYKYMYFSEISGKGNSRYPNVRYQLDQFYNSSIASHEEYVKWIADKSGNYFCEEARVVPVKQYDCTSYWNVEDGTTFMSNITEYTPTFECHKDENGYQYADTNIGLLTMDELWYSGYYYSCRDIYRDGYFKQNVFFWTMSPSGTTSGGTISHLAYVWGGQAVTLEAYPFPVINLRADTTATRNGNGYYTVTLD